jgi:hypothetical protein
VGSYVSVGHMRKLRQIRNPDWPKHSLPQSVSSWKVNESRTSVYILVTRLYFAMP